MTYSGAPLDGGSLIVTAEHSETDPVWRNEILRLVRSNGAGADGVRGVLLANFADDDVHIELARIRTDPGQFDNVVGLVTIGDHHLVTIRRPLT